MIPETRSIVFLQIAAVGQIGHRWHVFAVEFGDVDPLAMLFFHEFHAGFEALDPALHLWNQLEGLVDGLPFGNMGISKVSLHGCEEKRGSLRRLA